MHFLLFICLITFVSSGITIYYLLLYHEPNPKNATIFFASLVILAISLMVGMATCTGCEWSVEHYLTVKPKSFRGDVALYIEVGNRAHIIYDYQKMNELEKMGQLYLRVGRNLFGSEVSAKIVPSEGDGNGI